MEARRVTPGSVWRTPDRESFRWRVVERFEGDTLWMHGGPYGDGESFGDDQGGLDGWGYVGNVADVLTGLCWVWGRLHRGQDTGLPRGLKAFRRAMRETFDSDIANVLAAQAKVDNARTRRLDLDTIRMLETPLWYIEADQEIASPFLWQGRFVSGGVDAKDRSHWDPVGLIRAGRTPHPFGTPNTPNTPSGPCRCVLCEIPRNDGWGEDELKRRIDYLGRQAHLSLQSLGVWLTGAKKGLDRDR